MPSLPKGIGRRVRQARKCLEMTQVQLAERLELEESTVRAIETGRRGVSVETLVRLGGALHVPPGALLEDVRAASKPEAEAARLLQDLDATWKSAVLRVVREIHGRVLADRKAGRTSKN